jgi:hypothetical protein
MYYRKAEEIEDFFLKKNFPEGFCLSVLVEKKPPDDPLFRAKQFERLSLRGLVPLNGKTIHVDFGLKNHGIQPSTG